jgi:hypothetical protein
MKKNETKDAPTPVEIPTFEELAMANGFAPREGSKEKMKASFTPEQLAAKRVLEIMAFHVPHGVSAKIQWSAKGTMSAFRARVDVDAMRNFLRAQEKESGPEAQFTVAWCRLALSALVSGAEILGMSKREIKSATFETFAATVRPSASRNPYRAYA